jgi:hypothetical protein
MGMTTQLTRYSVKLGYVQRFASNNNSHDYFWDAEHAIWDRDLCKFVNDAGEVDGRLLLKCPAATTISVIPDRIPPTIQRIVDFLNENNTSYEKDFCDVVDRM